MILVLNFSTLSPDSYDSKEEMLCLAHSCFTYVKCYVLTSQFHGMDHVHFQIIFFQDMHLSGIVKDCASAFCLVVVLSPVLFLSSSVYQCKSS